jgi:hypothetical protein
MSEKQLDMLIKIRDGSALIMDAINEYLQSLAPPESGSASGGPCKTRALSSYDVNKIAWQQVEGPRGLYQKTDGDNTPNYQALLKELQAHKGKMNIGGSFYWLFENQRTIGRKPRGTA